MIKASDYPIFLYDTDKYKPGDIYSGLFQGPLLVKHYQHVFTGPTSSTKETSSGGKVARGIRHKLKAPTPRTIAYVAIMVCFCHICLTSSDHANKLRCALSSLPGFQNNDKGFNLIKFYHNILTAFNEPVNFEDKYNVDQSTAEWIASMLRWWKAYVYYARTSITNAISGRFLVYRKGVSTLKVKAKIKVEVKTVMKERATLQNSKRFGTGRLEEQITLLLIPHFLAL